MPYEAEKDKLITNIASVEMGEERAEISIKQYNGGPKKVRYQRVGETKKGKEYHEPLAKLTVNEFKFLLKHAAAILKSLE